MRRVPIALVLLLVFASAATSVQVHASTECERWISEYRDQLAHSDLAKRANAARHRLHRYVHRRLAAFRRPSPRTMRARVLPARLQRPKMTREEILRELEFACGELPVDPVELKQNVAYAPAPVFGTGMAPDEDDSMPLLAQNGPQSLLVSNDGPGEGAGIGWPPGVGGIGGWGGGTGGKNPPGNGSQTTPPPNNPPPDNPPPDNPPPTAVAPEPGSLLLVATGLFGIAAALRLKVRRAAQPQGLQETAQTS